MASKHKPLTDSLINASDEIHDFSCSVCKDNNLNIEAKYFCGDCSKYYCDKCLIFHAKIHQRHVVLGRKYVAKWMGHGDALVTCDLHPPKVLELLCEDHAELCCSHCVPLNHRMCGSISLISDLAKGIHKKTDFKQLPANVTNVIARLNQMSEARKKNQNSMKTSGSSILTKIKSLRFSLNKLLDELEKRTVEQMDSVLTDLNGSLQKDIDHCDLLHDQLKALLDTVEYQEKEFSSYIGYRKCKDKMAEANRLLREMDTKHEATISFQPDTRTQKLLSNLKALGNIQGYPDPQFEQSSGHIKQYYNKSKVFKVKEKKIYSVNIKKDREDCFITGMTELAGGVVVLVDSNNCTIKVLNSEYKVTSHCYLPEYPQDICLISDNQVAVAVDNGTDRQEVYFLTVSADTVKMTRKFSVDHWCNSIKHHEGQLYVGSLTALYLYTMAGRLVQNVYEDTSAEVTLNRFDLSTDGMNLYLPASSQNKVIIIDKAGIILAILHDRNFDWPSSVHVSEGGHVFVCFNRSHTVMQIDQEGRKKLATLVREGDGINQPQAVLHSYHYGRLIVGGDQSDILVVELE